MSGFDETMKQKNWEETLAVVAQRANKPRSPKLAEAAAHLIVNHNKNADLNAVFAALLQGMASPKDKIAFMQATFDKSNELVEASGLNTHSRTAFKALPKLPLSVRQHWNSALDEIDAINPIEALQIATFADRRQHARYLSLVEDLLTPATRARLYGKASHDLRFDYQTAPASNCDAQMAVFAMTEILAEDNSRAPKLLDTFYKAIGPENFYYGYRDETINFEEAAYPGKNSMVELAPLATATFLGDLAFVKPLVQSGQLCIVSANNWADFFTGFGHAWLNHSAEEAAPALLKLVDHYNKVGDKNRLDHWAVQYNLKPMIEKCQKVVSSDVVPMPTRDFLAQIGGKQSPNAAAPA